MPNAFETLSDEAKSIQLLDYVKGRLSDEEKAAIDAAIIDDHALAEELTYYQALSNASVPADTPQDHDLAWARLSKALDQTSPAQNAPKAANDNTVLWRAATLALGLIVAVQGGFLMSSDPSEGDNGGAYIPASEQAALIVKVMFSGSATSEDISTLLTDLDAEIVSGPSAIGLYDIRFETEAAQKAGLEALNTATGIVDVATPQ